MVSNAELFGEFIKDKPQFQGLSIKSQADFEANAIPIINNSLGGPNNVFSSLMNVLKDIRFNDLLLTNPLSVFHKSPEEFGAYMEEIGLKRVTETRFRDKTNPKDQFSTRFPDLDTALFKINRRSQYSVTYEDVDVRSALLSSDGLNRLISSCLDLLYKSDVDDTYSFIKRLFSVFAEAQLLNEGQVVEIPDLTDEELSAEDTRRAILRIKKAGKAACFNSDRFNVIGRRQAMRPENTVLIINFEALAQNEVQNLSQAFNTSYMDVDIPMIAVDGFEGNTDIIGVICDKDAFGYHNMVPDQFSQSHDAQNLYTNHFFTKIQMYHASPFSNTIYLVKPGTSNRFLRGDKSISDIVGAIKTQSAKVEKQIASEKAK